MRRMDKKRPRWLLYAATEADQPGMGMTNRVIPAQGEERGASFTLTGLDGDASRKFQPSSQQLLAIFTMCSAAPIVGARNLITANSALNGTFTPAFALRRRGNRLAAAHGIAPSDLKSVRFVPIASNTYIDFKGNRQRRRLGHVRPQRSHHGLDRLVRHFQDQFVMHLHDELSRYPRALQP